MSQSPSATILLVEDETAVLHLGTTMLTNLGYSVLTAHTPHEAMRLAEAYSGQISLLITDVVMPDMNGRELADRLRSLSPNLKCLYMSGYAADVIAYHGVLQEGRLLLQKSFSLQDLAVKVRAALGEEETSG